ncbi:hypothetical protein ILUMI_06456 [Ignelater luminosus]|uniref:CN hydrolase domain-containing protein n=1 Tax=Ignelater luminosus TaxID=2038154 RepID=A0A8K0GCK2_IGNLU|nr:hypothetical protein ILUMI_06456 [Ignelater luminosus]
MIVGITIFFYFMLVSMPGSKTQRVYRAAVVEYAPKREAYYLPHQIVMENTNQYIQLIDKISPKKVDIIIFPEYGSTTLEVMKKVPAHLESYSIKIPEITHDNWPNPCCNTSEKYHKALINLSCAARTANVHVVVHFLEREGTNESTCIFYSTNIVFNNNGSIIHKYRKINLHTEEHLQRGTSQTSYFKTNFGVTFGLLAGADVLYKYPSNNFLNQNVTDIIYTTAWHSETPFLYGLSTQQGYAKANKVNLLSACLSDPSNNSTGSGIYFSNGSLSDYTVSGIKSTRFIIRDIETEQKKLGNKSDTVINGFYKTHDVSSTTAPQSPDDLSLTDHIQLATEDLTNYTFKNIDINRVFVEGCSETHKSCCYSITTDHQQQAESKYSYKLVSFTGVRSFHRRTIGISICAVVACESYTSCGIRSSSSPTRVFNNISVSMLFENASNGDFRPITLNYNLLPSTNYRFERGSLGNDVACNITSTTPHNSLLTYGIFGRIYHKDNKIEGASQKMTLVDEANRTSNNRLNNHCVSIIAIAINLLLYNHQCAL